MSVKSASHVIAEARAIYDQGLREQAAGRIDAAIALFDNALRINPDFPEALCSGGYILQTRGHIQGALAFYGRAIELKPDYFDAYFNRGCILFAQNDLSGAIASFEAACAIRPRDAAAFANLGGAFQSAGRFQDAVRNLQRAIELDVSLIEAHLNLGSSLRRLGRYAEALAAYEMALKRNPDDALAYCGIGIVSRELGLFDAAMRAYDRALALQPDLDEALSSRCCLQLLQRDFENGWNGYEHRWLLTARPVPVCDMKFDIDRPETMDGKTVLIVNDHGLGDTIQFFRYAVILARSGAKVTFAGPPKMHRLLASCKVDIAFRDEKDLSGDFDARIALSSLPRAFSTVEASIPAPVPYICAEPDRMAFWRQKMAGPGLKVGLCWRGSQDFRVDLRRSILPSMMSPLSNVPGVQFYALHMDVRPDELPGQLAERVHVFGDNFDRGADAFVDTAAVMAQMDLVISCDTSVLHLAGALGRPTWALLRHIAEWRWMADRVDSPWYPTMRLLRCEAGDQWGPMFEEVAGELTRMAAEKRAS